MTDNSSDTPGVIIFPPLIPLSVLIVGIILNFVMPLGLLTRVPFLGRIVVGIIAFVVGLGTGSLMTLTSWRALRRESLRDHASL